MAVFHGMRVRMGMYTGISNPDDIYFNRAAGARHGCTLTMAFCEWTRIDSGSVVPPPYLPQRCLQLQSMTGSAEGLALRVAGSPVHTSIPGQLAVGYICCTASTGWIISLLVPLRECCSEWPAR